MRIAREDQALAGHVFRQDERAETDDLRKRRRRRPRRGERAVGKGRLELLVSPDVLKKRRAAWKAPNPPLERGYWRLYFDHVNQAHQGADLDFLVGKSGAFVPRDNH